MGTNGTNGRDGRDGRRTRAITCATANMHSLTGCTKELTQEYKAINWSFVMAWSSCVPACTANQLNFDSRSSEGSGSLGTRADSSRRQRHSQSHQPKSGLTDLKYRVTVHSWSELPARNTGILVSEGSALESVFIRLDKRQDGRGRLVNAFL